MHDREMAQRVATRFMREAGRGEHQIHKVMSTIQGAYRRTPRLIKTLENATGYKGDLAVGARAALKLVELGEVVVEAGTTGIKLYAKILGSPATKPHHIPNQATLLTNAVKEMREANAELRKAADTQDRFMQVVGRNVMKAMEEVEAAVANTLLPALEVADEALG